MEHQSILPLEWDLGDQHKALTHPWWQISCSFCLTAAVFLSVDHSSPRMDNVSVSCFEVAWIQFLLMDFYFYFQGGEGTWEWSESIRNCLACVWSPENTPDSHCAWLYQQVESTPGEVHLSPGSVASVSIGNFLKKKLSNEICLSARVAESTIVAQGLGIVSL